MDIRYFQYFIEVHKCGSINKAAQNLYISQPTLTNAIKTLEREMQCTLFVRSNVGMSLTPTGKEFLVGAQSIVNEYEKLTKIGRTARAHENLSVGFTYSAALMQSFMRFRTEHPPLGKEDVIREAGLDFVLNLIGLKTNRLGICYLFRSNYPQIKSKLEEKNIGIHLITRDLPLEVVMSAKNPLAKRSYLTLEDLQESNMLVFGGWERNQWLDILGHNQRHNLLVVFDRGGMYDAIRHSNYILVALRERFQDFEKNDCVSIPLKDMDNSLDLYSIYAKNYRLNPRELAYIQYLKTEFQNHK